MFSIFMCMQRKFLHDEHEVEEEYMSPRDPCFHDKMEE